ncbi:DEAD/DEAH box helicase [Pseudomonas capsici]|uniref:DEAD/DEAH box helicase n=1 Tax=Pseudomonas capsici TaxID=2810614 RepID=UPI0021F12F1E|nr:DEAD/DEAH box helicase [Pseudomonas capsici]MCV4290444.1 DEAD/DEAH box helicase [Pseudomonas capsici]
MTPTILLSYDANLSLGIFSRGDGVSTGAWLRLRGHSQDAESSSRVSSHQIALSWPAAMNVLREAAPLQSRLGFVFDTDESSEDRIKRFMEQFANVAKVSGSIATQIAPQEIMARLENLGWRVGTHQLKSYQLQNLQTLLALSNGANFSVPGAGKTTVTFALHLLSRTGIDALIVVAPNNAFPAWESVIDECLDTSAASDLRLPFTSLTGGEAKISALLNTRPARLIISYDQLVRVDHLISNFMATNRVHLILDESHRMKSGYSTQRGAVLLRIGHLAVRRDILSGTPMPQGRQDVASQLDFLWPGHGYGSKISAGYEPRELIRDIHVRTTKKDLDLPKRIIKAVCVDLSKAHLALYGVLISDVVARGSELRSGKGGVALLTARKCVMRVLQAATNPSLVLPSLESHLVDGENYALVEAVRDEGPSARVLKTVELAEQLIGEGKKVLIWTIFTDTLHQLEGALAKYNPAAIHGSVTLGDATDSESRQGQLRRFKEDPNCHVMIANPAAASEGISLHQHCHDAIYVDRSYNATHYLQSIDRIHRLGLPSDQLTTIYIMQNALPPGTGSIDRAVSRRLIEKVRRMQELLDDPDLQELTFDEQEATKDLDSIDLRDIMDLIEEIENPVTQDFSAEFGDE